MLNCVFTFQGKHNYVAEFFNSLPYQLVMPNVKKWECGKYFKPIAQSDFIISIR